MIQGTYNFKQFGLQAVTFWAKLRTQSFCPRTMANPWVPVWTQLGIKTGGGGFFALFYPHAGQPGWLAGIPEIDHP
jgi:hypothetical protein